jgi:hypothetical protein
MCFAKKFHYRNMNLLCSECLSFKVNMLGGELYQIFRDNLDFT